MDKCEEGGQRNCGRQIFREADLAYLLIDRERMFPLAELLASLFSNTARTTLFTRMEKINTRRHFCSADEIKLLKTVNGIHGSSAICTLIPEADVQKYCAVYIDRTVDPKLFSKGKKTRKESTRRKDSQSKDSFEGSNSTQQEKTAAKSNVGSDKVNAIKSLKRKTQASSIKQKINDGAKAKVSWEGHDSFIGSHSQLLGERSSHEEPNSPAILAEHVTTTNYTQTLQALNDQAIKTRKRKTKHGLGDEFTTTNSSQKKRSKNKDNTEKTIYSPSKASGEGDSANVIDGSSLAMPSSSLTDNLENPCASSLSQCLTNANSEILFSDSSSNDSGFASTTISENHNSPVCTDKHISMIASKLTLSLKSPSKQSKKTKSKKNKHENQDCDSRKRDPSSSPPPLVIKRQNNTWQVETKVEYETHKRTGRQTQTSKSAKQQLKWPKALNVSKDNLNLNNKEVPLKKTKKQKIHISDKDALEAVNNVEVKRNIIKKRGKRRKLENDNKVDKDEPNKMDPEQLINKGSNLSRIQAKNNKPGRLGKKQILKSNPKTSSTNIDHSQHNKKHAFATKTLKANKNFKLMGLFTSFPFLTVKDGDLCPAYSEAVVGSYCSAKLPSQPISKWSLGGPIFTNEKPR